MEIPHTEQNASIQEQVYQTLRSQILGFAYPPGTSISTQETADRLAVSRTPVREAFIRLQREGLVTMLPKRETLISPISPDRVRQERFIRLGLETAAIHLFPWHHAVGFLEQMNHFIALQMTAGVERDQETLLKLDDSFHRLIFEASDMPLAWDFLSGNSTHYQRIRLLSLWQNNRAEQIILEHQEYLRALEQGRLKTAEEILEHHVSALDSEEQLLKRLYPSYFVSDPPGDFAEKTEEL